MLCKLYSVTRSGYYAWLNRSESYRRRDDSALSDMINKIFDEQRGCGATTIKGKLANEGINTSIRRVKRLMDKAGLKYRNKPKYKSTTDSGHGLSVVSNKLKQEFTATAPNQVWVGDITHIPTKEGWLYLATVIDLYSRKVVGWSMDSNMKADLVNNALTMALFRRKPNKGLIWHTDRGSQYCSISHRKIINDHKIIQSMSRKGNCWDNAVAESFFATIKKELVHKCEFKTIKEASSAIFEYIEVFYNRIRAHSTNGYYSPAQYELKAANCM